MVGILVHGNNHFILSGSRPTQAEAMKLARYWSIVQIGEVQSQKLAHWEIRNKEFRENLKWAVIVEGDRETSHLECQSCWKSWSQMMWPSTDTAATNSAHRVNRPKE